MKLHSYLHLSRHNIYIFRRRIPKNLQNYFNTNEIRQSLGTSSLNEAVAHARILANDSDNLFYLLKNNMSDNDDKNRLMQIIREKAKHVRALVQIEELTEQLATSKRENELIRTFAPPLFSGSTKPVEKIPMLSELVNEFLSPAEIIRRGEKPATIRKNRDALKLFIDIVGDRPINEVTQVEASTFSKLILTHKYKGGKRSPNTINGHMGSVSKFSGWVTAWHSKSGHMMLDFSRLRYKREKAPSKERDMFELSEIEAIIGHDKFYEARKHDPEKYWLILIALFSGMRLEEITQLNPNTDIYIDEAGLFVFDINEGDGKSLKNFSSARLIPVHSKLIELGLLEYVKSIKPKAKRLFPKSSIRDSRTGKNIGKRANYFINRVVGIKGKTLHSFRHTFATLLKRAKVEEAVAAEIIGHAHGGVTFSRYGKNFLTELLQETIENHINFKFIE